MKRLLFSTIGVILTFAWIIYTAPDKDAKAPAETIKTIKRTGAEPIKKIGQPKQKNGQPADNKSDKSPGNPPSEVIILAANDKQ